MIENKFPYTWSMANTEFTKDKFKVFTCFACGGGSSFGYKLAGGDVIGCNEIDKRMMSAYLTNHKPKYSFLESIETFKDRKDLPEELYDLDILDGSPPCSSFSMCGNREDDWGKEKVFKEGQAKQVLDTLFFNFIDLAKELQPKVVVAENVKGLLMGSAKKYVGAIGKAFDDAGYYVEKWLLNAKDMGVPQKRERVFFVAIRKDFAGQFDDFTDMFNPMPKLGMNFNQKEIPFGEIYEPNQKTGVYKIPPAYGKAWEHRKAGDNDLSCTMGRVFNRPNSFFSVNYIYKHKVVNTITGAEKNILFDEKRGLSLNELFRAGTWPSDYDFGKNLPTYIIGMSVPPVMVAQIATRIYNQWLSKLK